MCILTKEDEEAFELFRDFKITFEQEQDMLEMIVRQSWGEVLQISLLLVAFGENEIKH